MSHDYRPDNDATAGDPWDVAFLSDRDVSGQVPINYVPHPGVHLTPACFGNGTYEDNSFKECFSNLLASEFRRFVIDVYWDVLNRQFRLCPVELPSQSRNTTAEALQWPLMTRGLARVSSMMNAPFVPRQASSLNVTITGTSNQTLTTTANSTTATTSVPPVSTSVSQSGNILYQVGPYQCTESLTFDTIISILSDYITMTSTTLQARLQFIIINLHAAATISSPTSPRQPLSQVQLPNSNELISSHLKQLSPYVYTPFLLGNERQNLNNSWFARGKATYFPLLNYFTTWRLPNGDISTSDGWPNENYVQLEQGWRLLIGYDLVDSQISDYNFLVDSETIFEPGYLTSQINTTIDSSGRLSSGCFYNSSDSRISQVNASWAVSSITSIDQSILGFAADNLTTCGISPMLNLTLNNRPASTNYAAYQNFGNQALFSWASGEPKNASVAGQTSSNVKWACALMVSNDEYQGHWRVTDCAQKRRVACREANQPYTWRLSSQAVQYDAGDGVCTGNGTFDVPRTGLENQYLYHQVRATSTNQQDMSILDGVWINFNSLDMDACWVTTGPTGTCPYPEDRDTVRQRKILVPTIAAFITLLITALTILVKCNTNRRKSKARKRGEGGWDYEGVPS